MADKKTRTQAEKAAMAKKKNASGTAKKGKNNQKTQEPALQIPVRAITAVTCLVLFILFLVIFLKPDGVLVEKVFLPFVLGMIGNVAFYVSIPGLLYLFTIQAFSGKRPILLRSVCLISFVLICGCISQLSLPTAGLPTGLSILVALFQGGAAGTTAGLLCGGVALLLQWLCGTAISYIILIVAALFTLLAAFQITIPSIIRAIENRPRADWEDEEKEEVPEPAAVVVNHIANKRIEHKENKRRIQAERAMIDIPLDDDEPAVTAPKRKPS